MVKYLIKSTLVLLLLITSFHVTNAQFTAADTLRGSLGPGRTWWDVKQYNLSIDVDINDHSIKGTNRIVFDIVKAGKNRYMQIDLQKPMQIEKIEYAQNKYGTIPFKREGNVYWVDFGDREFQLTMSPQEQHTIIIHFKGQPRVAVNAPWDGGWIWAKDEQGRPWVTAACQGLGASVWYPCKDHQSDEPENGASLSITAPDSLVAVGNGRLKNRKVNGNGTATSIWEVTSPINNYNLIPYIGAYVNWQEKFDGEKGDLDCSYWVLDYNLDKAKKQFGRDVKPMLKCFESWFGPYPFYGDSYKLVETPHLGMEHQSAVAYGNHYTNGYLGNDLSRTGWGKDWDYIIIHESGHEWFANNITTRDIADMWIHEGFTSYSEALFVECQYGVKAGNEYCQGLRGNIRNKAPVIGPYGVNTEGSGDMYPKGANLIHTVRQIINDDAKFRSIMRGLNKDFYHRLVDSKEVENYFSMKSGKNLSKVFDQYLRSIEIPVLEYRVKGKTLSYHWANCIPGFSMPVKVTVGKKVQWITPQIKWQTLPPTAGFDGKTFTADKNFYIDTKKVD